MSKIHTHILRPAVIGLVALVCSLVLGGCFHNDGYIGVYFGSWVIEKITIDGEPDPNYKGHTMISFQSSFFDMTDLDGGGQILGIWEDKDKVLTLQGAAETASRKDADDNPIFPTTTGFGSGTDHDLTVRLDIVRKDSSKMVWERTDSRGRVWKYTLSHVL